MKKEINFRIFVIHHCPVNDEYYQTSMLDNLVFVNVRQSDVILNEKYRAIKMVDFPKFKALGSWYTESEVIYNLHNNKEYYCDVDYVGFIQYDMDASVLDKELIQQLFQKEESDVIFFQPFTFHQDYNQKVLMDPKYPNKLMGKGLNCYETIFADFNKYYNVNHNTQMYNEEIIGLCSAFLIKTSLFDQMMDFASSIIESKKLDSFDTRHHYRIQGGLLERYYAAWMLLKKSKFSTLPIPHSFDESHAQMSYYEKLRIFLTKKSQYLKRKMKWA